MNGTRVMMNGRTVGIISEYSEVQRTGSNGDFVQKSVQFKIAVRRGYKQNIVDPKTGNVSRGYETDFWLVKATGDVATAFWQNCGQYKDANGKHKSRLISVDGRMETYSKPRKVNVQANIGGTVYNIETEVANTNTIVVADNIEFLDPNPNRVNNVQSGPAPVVATPVPAGQVGNGNVVQAQPVQSQVQPVQTQTMQAQPVQPIQSQPQVHAPVNMGQPAQTQVQMGGLTQEMAAAMQNLMEGFMNAPVAEAVDTDADPF